MATSLKSRPRVRISKDPAPVKFAAFILLIKAEGQPDEFVDVSLSRKRLERRAKHLASLLPNGEVPAIVDIEGAMPSPLPVDCSPEPLYDVIAKRDGVQRIISQRQTKRFATGFARGHRRLTGEPVAIVPASGFATLTAKRAARKGVKA